MEIGAILPHTKLFGGVRRYLELGNVLVSRGHGFHLFTPDGEGPRWFRFAGQMHALPGLDTVTLDALITSEEVFLPQLSASHAPAKVFYVINKNKALRKISGYPEICICANSTTTLKRIRQTIHKEPFRAFGTEDFLVHNRTGLVVRRSAGSIARAIEKLVRSDKLRERLAANGLQRISSFGWEKTADALLGILQAIKNGRAEPDSVGSRIFHKPIKRLPKDRTLERLLAHYEVERDIAMRLRRSDRAERIRLYSSMYDELFSRVPDHPRLRAHLDNTQNEKRNRSKLLLIEPYISEQSVAAEFAPGDCAFARFLCAKVKDVYAFDISDQAIGNEALPPNFHYIIYDGYNLDKKPKSIDTVFSDQFIEHLHPEDVGGHFGLVYKLLKEGGWYVLRAPHRFLGPHDISKYFSRSAEGFHLCEPTYRMLARECRAAGFRRLRMHGRIRGRYVTLPAEYFLLVEKLLDFLPLRARKFFSRPLLPRQLLLAVQK
jgi:hypothetical protein